MGPPQAMICIHKDCVGIYTYIDLFSGIFVPSSSMMVWGEDSLSHEAR